MHIDTQIAALKAQLQETRDELRKLESIRAQSLELEKIPHIDAVDKLRDIFSGAKTCESAQDFLLEIMEDPQLFDWFGTSD